MFARFSPFKCLAVIVLIGVVAFTAVPGRAASILVADVDERSTRLGCHESRYYLYVAGKWFCVARAPMECVNCHGGDPTAIDQAAVHQNRKARPIVNDDTTTCRQCYVDDCAERVQKFDQIAGMSHNVLVATTNQPTSIDPQPVTEALAAELDPIVVLWSLGGTAMLAACLGGVWLLRRHNRSAKHS